MNIRGKIILIVLPLIVTPLLFAGMIATLLARNGITSIATQFLQFKAEQVESYANGQWTLLEENGYSDQESFQSAAKDAIRSFAQGVIRSDSELIIAANPDNSIGFVVGADAQDVARIGNLGAEPQLGWSRIGIQGIGRVSYAVAFEPFSWTIYVTERESVFYASTTAIVRQVGMVAGISVGAGLVLLILFAGYLTRPLRKIVDTMTNIIETSDLAQRVDVLSADETGRLAHTFNIMTAQLERAYEHIKSYAMRAATARLKEMKTRTMFQKYVPSDVIEQFFSNPEKMLVGENRVVSILFSDIRNFTSISEMMQPEQVVETLNHYFTIMVDTIMNHHGIVDKYIGDAIMALFGTPEKRDDDARESVFAGLDMVDALRDFNVWQERRELPMFRTGIGINYGIVTVGNIGTEKKLDYTVIGDMVNVASRLEGLTKKYRLPIVISESVHRKLERDVASGRLTTRLLDIVQVKGRANGLRVYTVARSVGDSEREAWSLHDEAMGLFYARDFAGARERFTRVASVLKADAPSAQMIARCDELIRRAPAKNWTGIVEMTEK